MINASDLLTYSSHFATERHLEKDYLQTVLLNEIYAEFSTQLVFKGGTALQKLYGLNRFSEDLDFTYNGNAPEQDKEKLYLAIKRMKEQYPFEIHTEQSKQDSILIELKNIRGPLYPIKKSSHTIKIDISLRERPLLEPQLKIISPIYRDIKQFSIYAMNLDEILSEKVRAIFTRTKARDVYDLYFIIMQRGAKFDEKLINSKLAPQKLQFSKQDFMKRIEGITQKLWKEELSNTVRILPEYPDVVNYIVDTIKAA